MNAESAAAAAAKRNVDLTPVDRYSQGKMTSQALQLGFAALDVQRDPSRSSGSRDCAGRRMESSLLGKV
jgi:hypothetical protein